MVRIYVQITNFIYSVSTHLYDGQVLSKDGLRSWELPNTGYAQRLNGRQHNSLEQYPND